MCRFLGVTLLGMYFGGCSSAVSPSEFPEPSPAQIESLEAEIHLPNSLTISSNSISANDIADLVALHKFDEYSQLANARLARDRNDVVGTLMRLEYLWVTDQIEAFCREAVGAEASLKEAGESTTAAYVAYMRTHAQERTVESNANGANATPVNWATLGGGIPPMPMRFCPHEFARLQEIGKLPNNNNDDILVGAFLQSIQGKVGPEMFYQKNNPKLCARLLVQLIERRHAAELETITVTRRARDSQDILPVLLDIAVAGFKNDCKLFAGSAGQILPLLRSAQTPQMTSYKDFFVQRLSRGRELAEEAMIPGNAARPQWRSSVYVYRLMCYSLERDGCL